MAVGLFALWRRFRGPTESAISLAESRRRASTAAELDVAAREPAQDLPGPYDRPIKLTPDQLLAECRELAEELTTGLGEDHEAWCVAGQIHFAFNEMSKAQTCWETAVRQKADSAEAHLGLGEAAWVNGKFGEAAEHLQMAMDLNPRVGHDKAVLLADALMNLNQSSEAAAALKAAALQAPLPPQGISLLGHAYLESGEYAKGARCFEQLLVAQPHFARHHYALARCYDKLGDARRAEQHRAEYARLRKLQRPAIEQMRADSRGRDYADATPLLRKFHTAAGRLYANHGEVELAEKHWLRALALDPPNAECRTLLAHLYRRQGRTRDAARVAERRQGLPPFKSGTQ